MSPVTKERIAFWGEVLVAASMTVVAILVASRLGYREAVRYARYEDLRGQRNLMRTIERELASNEAAMLRALEDWASDDFRYLHVVTGALDRARENDVWFQLNPETTEALSGVYPERLRETIAGIRKQRGGPIFRLYAINVGIYLERIARARPLLRKEIAAVEAELAKSGFGEVAPDIEWPAAPAIEPTPEETEALALTVTAGWERPSAKYEGPLHGLSLAREIAISARPRGPVLVSWRVSEPPEGRKPARLWICLLPALPMRSSLRLGEDDELLRRFHLLDLVEGAFALGIPVEEWEGEVIDPNQPGGWRWVCVLVEDDAGERHFARPECWKVGKDQPWGGWKEPGEKAVVLPKGHLRK